MEEKTVLRGGCSEMAATAEVLGSVFAAKNVDVSGSVTE